MMRVQIQTYIAPPPTHVTLRPNIPTERRWLLWETQLLKELNWSTSNYSYTAYNTAMFHH